MKTDNKSIFEQHQAVTENKWQNPVVDVYGTKHWYNEQGQVHREDGPAAVYANGYKGWYVDGEYYFTILEWTEAIFIYKGHTPKKFGQERFDDLVRAFAQKMESMYES